VEAVLEELRGQLAIMEVVEIETRRADSADAEAITAAHIDSIESIGPRFYPPELVDVWKAGLKPDVYLQAMREGEVFFIAIGCIHGESTVLGFATHRVDDAQDGVSVYVRGVAARHGIGTRLLRLAEEHAREHGATSIEIQASLAGVDFYKANGFEELSAGEALLMSGRSMPCVFMRKRLSVC
jgi:GNAT superfamily N-acetyltransferase